MYQTIGYFIIFTLERSLSRLELLKLICIVILIVCGDYILGDILKSGGL